MRMGILGRKVGMTQIFDANGATVPVTVVDTSECFITQVKTKQHDGYNALQVAAGMRKPQNVNKAKAGHFKKAGVAAKANTQELRLGSEDNVSHLKAGQLLTAKMFEKGDKVDVTSLSKGKGFQGVVKRWGFHGADASHGAHEYFRHTGSIGTKTFPGRTLKNKGMPGQMGNKYRTIQGLEVVEVREKENLLFLKGSVPGFHDKYILVRSSVKAKAYPERPWTA